MHDPFIRYIGEQLNRPLTDAEIQLIKEIFSVRKLRKHGYFLQEGEVCKQAGFVVKGALKQYTIDEAGKENVLGLLIENWWVADRESFSKGTPSSFYIDAYEDTVLLVISKEDYTRKLEKLPFITELSRILSERQALQLLKRVHNGQVMTAEERLRDLEKTYPEFLQRFPQHLIASYLGMTKETLSRIRAGQTRK